MNIDDRMVSGRQTMTKDFRRRPAGWPGRTEGSDYLGLAERMAGTVRARE